MRSSQWKKPSHINELHSRPLHKRVQSNLVKLCARISEDGGRTSGLQESVITLVNSLKKADRASQEDWLMSLKDVIYKSHAVSTHGTSSSLENQLRQLGLDRSVTESREVLEIDKLSKYPELCKDLIRISRQPKTRTLCKNIKLETCDAYPGL
jgi:hypothetical protein